MKTTSRTLGALGVLSGAIAFFLLIFPYYYLGQDAYILKSNPDMEYFLPKSLEAWSFLLLALSFLSSSMIALTVFGVRKRKERI